MSEPDFTEPQPIRRGKTPSCGAKKVFMLDLIGVQNLQDDVLIGVQNLQDPN